jgi:adenylate cyclase
VHCEACGFDNPIHFRFCGACAARLYLTCPACLSVASPRLRFCGACGTGLVEPGSGAAASASSVAPPAAVPAPPPATPSTTPAPALPAVPLPPLPIVPPVPSSSGIPEPSQPAAPEGERRQVSVLFTDMSGSTAIAEKMDPEEFTTIVNDLFTQLGACITRYDGHIDKFIGDAIMATFGAPVAHENDPERAVLAALDMQETMQLVGAELEQRTGVLLRMRVGINTGEVIAGHVGSETRSDYTVMGDTVNVASRLEHHAPVGGIMVSESTYRRTRDIFEWRVLDPIEVKGKAEPLAVYQPIGRHKGGRGIRGIEWVDTPHIGRDHLLQEAISVYHRACGGMPQLYAAVGDAGLGKSRLRHELHAAIQRAGGTQPRILLGRCLPYTQGSSWALVIGLLRDYLEIAEDDGAIRMLQQLEAAGLDEETTEVLIPLLTGGRVRGALDRLSPEQWQQAAFLAVRSMLEREAQTRPVLLFLEDLHWIDPSSRDLLTHLIANVRGLPVFYFLIYRPDFPEPPVWTGHPGFHRKELQPLSPAESAALIEAILPRIDLPTGVLDRIVARAAGNPFYIEEIVKSFVDAGAVRREGDAWVASHDVGQFQVPETVQAILRTRIDRLPEQPRRVLQQAAVIGRAFERSLLTDVSEVKPVEPHLDALVGGDFVQQSRDDTGVYTFPNVLAQEVTYSQLLVRRRRAYHRRVAEALERTYADRLETQTDTLARHYFHAEVWPKALSYGRQAADRARSLYANAEAIEHYRHCQAAFDHLERVLASEWDENRRPDLADLNRARLSRERHEVLRSLGEVQTLVGAYDDALATYRLALDAATAPVDRADILWRTADGVHAKRAKWQDALDALTTAANLLEGDDDDDAAVLRARVDTTLSQVYWRLQRVEEARAIVESCIAFLEGSDHHAELARALKQRGVVGFVGGALDEARTYFERGLEAARRTNDPREIVPFLQNLGVVAVRQARYDEAAARFEQSLALAERTGDIWSASTALNNLGGVAKARHHLDEAIALYERSARIKARIGDPRGVMIAYSNIAEAQGERGDPRGALEVLEKALSIANDVAARETVPPILRQMGEHRLALGEEGPAEQAAREALELARALGARLEIALAERLLGRLAARRDHADDAIALLTGAAQQLRDLKSPHELGVTLLDLAAASLAHGQVEQALAALGEAEAPIAATGAPHEKERLAALAAGVPARSA